MLNRAFVTSRKRILIFASIGVLVVVAAVGIFVLSAKSEVGPVNMDANKVAIHGYDTVAYFTDGKATKGKSEFSHVWHEARWYFASVTHRDLFVANPDRFAPRYGGYCSMGLAVGEYSDADPEVWTIVNGKLYLNFDKKSLAMWRKAPEAYIVASELNWSQNRNKLRIGKKLN